VSSHGTQAQQILSNQDFPPTDGPLDDGRLVVQQRGGKHVYAVCRRSRTGHQRYCGSG